MDGANLLKVNQLTIKEEEDGRKVLDENLAYEQFWISEISERKQVEGFNSTLQVNTISRDPPLFKTPINSTLERKPLCYKSASAAPRKKWKGRRRMNNTKTKSRKNTNKRGKTLRWRQNKRKKVNRAKRAALEEYRQLQNGCPVTEMCATVGPVVAGVLALFPNIFGLTQTPSNPTTTPLQASTPPTTPARPAPTPAPTDPNPIKSFGDFIEIFGKTYATPALEALAQAIFIVNLQVVEVRELESHK